APRPARPASARASDGSRRRRAHPSTALMLELVVAVGRSRETLLVEPPRHIGLEHLGRKDLEHGEVTALDGDRGHVGVGGEVEPLHHVALWCDHKIVIWVEVEHRDVDLVEPRYV